MTDVTNGRMLGFPFRREGEYIVFVAHCSLICTNGDCIMLAMPIFLVAAQKFSYG